MRVVSNARTAPAIAASIWAGPARCTTATGARRRGCAPRRCRRSRCAGRRRAARARALSQRSSSRGRAGRCCSSHGCPRISRTPAARQGPDGMTGCDDPAPPPDPPDFRVAGSSLGAGAVLAGPAVASRAPQPVPTPSARAPPTGCPRRPPSCCGASGRPPALPRGCRPAPAGARRAVRPPARACSCRPGSACRRRSGAGAPTWSVRGLHLSGANEDADRGRRGGAVRARDPPRPVRRVGPASEREPARGLPRRRGRGRPGLGRRTALARAGRCVPLVRHAEIVVEIEGYVPPHAAFLFPRRA